MPKSSIGPTQQVTDKAKARLQRDVEYAFANVGNEFPSVTEQEFTNMVPSRAACGYEWTKKDEAALRK